MTNQEKIAAWYADRPRIDLAWEEEHDGILEDEHMFRRVFLPEGEEVVCQAYLCTKCGMFVDLIRNPGSYDLNSGVCGKWVPIAHRRLLPEGLAEKDILVPDYEKHVTEFADYGSELEPNPKWVQLQKHLLEIKLRKEAERELEQALA